MLQKNQKSHQAIIGQASATMRKRQIRHLPSNWKIACSVTARNHQM